MRAAAIFAMVVAGAVACGTFLDTSSPDAPSPNPGAEGTLDAGDAATTRTPDATATGAVLGGLGLGERCTDSTECRSGRCKYDGGTDQSTGACVAETECAVGNNTSTSKDGGGGGGVVIPGAECASFVCCIDHYCRDNGIGGPGTEGCARCAIRGEPCDGLKNPCCGTDVCSNNRCVVAAPP